MRRLLQFYFLSAVLLLTDCTNIGLIDQLENPGNAGTGKEIYTNNYYVFVSSWTTLGAMGGSPYSDCNSITGPGRADCACTRAAISRGLRRSNSHVFRAWLSVDPTPGPQQDAICRVQGQGNGCANNFPSTWFNTQGQPVVGNFSNFTGSTFTNSIRFDEFGVDQGDNSVWTGTVVGGTAATSADCNDWTDQSAGTGKIGDRTFNNNLWTDNGNNTCGNSFRIYCVASPQF
jgi:hypothetical protein